MPSDQFAFEDPTQKYAHIRPDEQYEEGSLP
jgi:hypothetical protein